MTKSYLKDGNVDYALKFFEEGVNKRMTQKKEQEDYLESLFDSTLGLNPSDPLDLHSFKHKYSQAILVRSKIHQEMAAIKKLDNILQECDPSEIDNLYLLHIVLREERQLLKYLANNGN